LPTATQVARTIREQIRTELHLTAAASVAPNKFLAKIASDIQPEDVDLFLLSLPVDRLPGVGKVTQEKLKTFEVHTIAHLRRFDLPTLESRFGRFGVRLYELARGVDESKVVPGRPTQSISVEDTFERDVPLTETEPMIRKLAELTWAASRKENRTACTVVLKLKTAEFKILTRSHTPSSPPSSCEELTVIALSLRERVTLGSQQRFRLVGVGLSNFVNPEDVSVQPVLFG
jgi:DNA polymerase-4